MKPGSHAIDGKRAAQLRAKGASWKMVGRLMAQEEGRVISYGPESVARAAVRDALKKVKP